MNILHYDFSEMWKIPYFCLNFKYDLIYYFNEFLLLLKILLKIVLQWNLSNLATRFLSSLSKLASLRQSWFNRLVLFEPLFLALR